MLQTLAAACIFASWVMGGPLYLLLKMKNQFSTEGRGGRGRGLLHCTSPGPRWPLDPGLVLLILSFQKFHPCFLYMVHRCENSDERVSRLWMDMVHRCENCDERVNRLWMGVVPELTSQYGVDGCGT